MRSQNLKKPADTKKVTVIDERPAPKNIPVRTILYMEVGNSPSADVARLVKMINENYKNNEAGVHYVLPVRFGKITSDIYFENEWLVAIRDLLEIKDGQIVLKDGATDVKVTRETV